MHQIEFGNRENDKCLDGIRDLTAPQKRDSPKFEHGMRDFSPVCWEFRKSSRPK